MDIGTNTVVRIGQIYLERDSEMIEIMIVNERRCLRWGLGEFGARDFLVTFTELLTKLYEDKYKAKVEEISRLQEMIETYKKKGWRTEDEEKKLRALEEKATEYALKRDFLKKFIEDFKKMFYYD
jgi:hypothetical protein